MATYPKVVKFSFTSSNTGAYTMKVYLGGQLIGTLTNNGGYAQSIFMPATGVQATIVYNFWPVHNVTDGYINNNIWHDFTLYISNYSGPTSGSLTFEYTKTGLSRQVYIDNAQVYEAIPTPIPSQTNVTIGTCGGTYDLTKITISNYNSIYTYKWYTDVNHTNPVDLAATTTVNEETAVYPGTYYLFATSTCAGTPHSYPSQMVTVNAASGCCGSNITTNGNFEASTTSLTNWTIDNSTYQGTAQANNYNDGSHGSGGNTMLNPPTGTFYYIYQQVATSSLTQNEPKSCAYDPKKLIFDVAVDEEALNNNSQNKLTISLNGIDLAQLWANAGSPYDWNFSYILPGTTVTVQALDGVNPRGTQTFTSTSASNNTFWQYDGAAKVYWYRITLDITQNIAAGGNLSFTATPYIRWYLDNINLSNQPPLAENPKDMNTVTTPLIDGLTTCPAGTFDLTTAQPTVVASHTYRWYYDTAATQPVTDPTKVGPGTYYMQTISTCSWCVSTTTTAFVVTQACPVIKGTVYADYDGVTVNGISNPTNQGTNGGGLYAVLVSSTGVVLNSVKINTNGTYSLIGTTGTDMKIIINKDSILANGTNTLSTSTLNPNYVNTGDVIGGTTGSTTNDGISAQFSFTTGQTLTNVNFGIQSSPIAGDATSATCHLGAGATFTIPQLYSIDDDPNWNGGSGQMLVIESITATNGTLTYNGMAVSPTPYTITAYDPTKLVFTLGTTAASSIQFTYHFVDKAGASSNTAKISYSFAAITPAPTGNSTQYFCTTPNPTHYVSELSVTGTDIKWYDAATGGNQITSPTTTALISGKTYYASQTITDATLGTACESPTRLAVTAKLINQPEIITQPVGNTYCQNTSATVLSVVAGGVGTLTYQWYSNTTSSTSGGTAVGTNSSTYTPSTSTAGTMYYYVVVSGSCGSTTSTPVAIVVRPTPTATISGTTSVCQNSTPAPLVTFSNPQSLPVTITYTINGGADQTINVAANSSSTVSVSTATATTYTYALKSVQYQTAPNCPVSITGSAVITVNPLPTLTATTTPVQCSGESSGTATLTASGGSTPYTYSKDGTNYVSSNYFTGLAAGTYTFYVKTASGCIASTTATITQNTPISATVNPGIINCSRVTTDLTISPTDNLPSNYQYKIVGADGTVFDWQNNGSFSNIAQQSYTVYIRSKANPTTTCTMLGVYTPDNPCVEITKTADKTSVSAVGTIITYTITIRNTGNVGLTNVTVSDTKIGFTQTVASFPSGASYTYTKTYSVTQADLDNCTLVNTVNFKGTTDKGNLMTDFATNTIAVVPSPSWTITKTATETSYSNTGDILHFTIKVKNTGNVTISGVTLSDTGATVGSPSEDMTADGKLSPGETWTYSGTHTITTSDLVNSCSYTNTAAVSGVPSCGTLGNVSSSVTVNKKIIPPTISSTITQPTCDVPTGTVALNGLPNPGTWYVTAYNPDGTQFGSTITGTDQSSAAFSGLLPGHTYYFKIAQPQGCSSEASANVTIGPMPSCVRLWIGSTADQSFNTSSNWSNNTVPTPQDDVMFATGTNNVNGYTTLSDMVIPSTGVTIRNLTNESTFATVVPANSSLTVTGTVTGSETNPNRIQVQAVAGQPNGSLILSGQPCSSTVMGTVQMYAKGDNKHPYSWTDNIAGSPTIGNTFTGTYRWQHFGVPVQSVKADPTFYGSYLREYSEKKNLATSYYNKWNDLVNSSVLTLFKGYGITQPDPKMIAIQGALVFCNQSIILTRSADPVTSSKDTNENNYRYGLGQNIFGNSFTASIPIEQIDFNTVQVNNVPTDNTTGSQVEHTVYLYNTGTFGEWGGLANNNTQTSSTTQPAGSYISIPYNTASAMPYGRIPSMNGFLLKHVGTFGTTITMMLPYAQLVQNTQPQTAPREGGETKVQAQVQAQVQKTELSYLKIDLTSNSTRDALWLFSRKGTSENFDNGWDGSKFFGTPTAFIYSETPAGPMQVNTNKTIDNSFITFVPNGDTEYTLTLTKTNLDSDYTDLKLIDLVMRTVTPLDKETTTYKFTASNNGVSTKRFVIMNSRDVNLNSNQFKFLDAYVGTNNELVITNYTNSAGTMHMYDATGQTVMNQPIQTSVNRIPTVLQTGVYIVQMEAEGKRGIAKVIIK